MSEEAERKRGRHFLASTLAPGRAPCGLVLAELVLKAALAAHPLAEGGVWYWSRQGSDLRTGLVLIEAPRFRGCLAGEGSLI